MTVKATTGSTIVALTLMRMALATPFIIEAHERVRSSLTIVKVPFTTLLKLF